MTREAKIGGLGPQGQARIQESLEGGAVIDLNAAEAGRGVGAIIGVRPIRSREDVEREIQEHELQLGLARADARAQAAVEITEPQLRMLSGIVFYRVAE